jgi:hypothetical protein
VGGLNEDERTKGRLEASHVAKLSTGRNCERALRTLPA